MSYYSIPLFKDPSDMSENELAEVVIELAFRIHRKWGPGMLESVYEELMYHHLIQNGLSVERQTDIPFYEDGVRMKLAFRSDLIVQEKLLIELKSVERLALVHPKVVLTYLRLTNLKLGLLINFGDALLKTGLQRVVNRL
jgi:GxxExxY protein